jgi:hypothetical protein
VVNDQVNWTQRVDFLRVAAHAYHSVTHSRKVHYSWHSCEVLQQDTGRLERDFYLLSCGVLPV